LEPAQIDRDLTDVFVGEGGIPSSWWHGDLGRIEWILNASTALDEFDQLQI
jgi:hypothetical protein